MRSDGFGENHPSVVQLVNKIKKLKELKNDEIKDAQGDAAVLLDTVVQTL